MAGDGELLGVDSLGDGQGKVVPVRETVLLVGRYGIVDLRLDTIVREVFLQFVATLTQQGQDMIDRVARGER